MRKEGAENRSLILATGTPEEIAKQNIGYTSKFLQEELKIKV